MTYEEALNWLFVQTRGGAARDPVRMQQLLASLRLPSPPKVIHVVGTNGKGSTAAIIATGLTEAGFRTGRFVSPHVEDFRERIAVDNELIPQTQVVEFVNLISALGHWAFFEISLALALKHFAEQSVDYAVIEAGIGAKYDATNVLENKVLTVITNIAMDHQDTLGPTLTAIAKDKAAAITARTPVVTGAEGEALGIIQALAKETASPLFINRPNTPLFSPPASSHQFLQNAQLATASLRLLGMDEAAIRIALSESKLAGRREYIRVGDKTVLLDGAHNPAAAEALLECLDEGFVLLFGALQKKQGEATLAVLEPHAKEVIITQVAGQESLLNRPKRSFFAKPIDALRYGLEHTDEENLLVIAGSFYLAGELRPFLSTN